MLGLYVYCCCQGSLNSALGVAEISTLGSPDREQTPAGLGKTFLLVSFLTLVLRVNWSWGSQHPWLFQGYRYFHIVSLMTWEKPILSNLTWYSPSLTWPGDLSKAVCSCLTLSLFWIWVPFTMLLQTQFPGLYLINNWAVLFLFN